MTKSDALAEQIRLAEDQRREKNWKRWGPYLAERQWATVREDYSIDGNCWDYFPHDMARSRAYRWGEDGLLGICDRECRLCFCLALWNGSDAILKERLFGLTNPQGNHGEDVKELYYYLESSPTHTWMRALYKYPQGRFPYEQLIEENERRRSDPHEYELVDTGIFDANRYFDVQADYAKARPDDILVKVTITNRGDRPAELRVLPQLWFKNNWSWGPNADGAEPKPTLHQADPTTVSAVHSSLKQFVWHVEKTAGFESLLFTENETNAPRIFGTPHVAGAVYKDAFHEYVVNGKADAVNPQHTGTKAAAVYRLTLAPGASEVIRVRLRSAADNTDDPFGQRFDDLMQTRRQEFQQYQSHVLGLCDPEHANIAGQAIAGLLWSKQYYGYVVREWLSGDPDQPPPPPEREKHARNKDWKWNLYNRDVISMPDKWEYPWYASWDLAFHMILMSRVDPQFAKDQLILLMREWYMHPSGQLPAYEFNFSDVNPPVHAWACWRVYKTSAGDGPRDLAFLARAFQKLMLNFTWWVNRKDESGNNLFGGGFLGLDNIGLFDRSQPLPTGGRLEQADGTAWMAFFCGTMLSMALELAAHDPTYEDVASKFFEHFIAITEAINRMGGTGLWDEDDGFYYDQIFVEGQVKRLKIRSMVGIIPLFACEVLRSEHVKKLPGFKKRLEWFLEHRIDLKEFVAIAEVQNSHRKMMVSVADKEKLRRVLSRVLDETDFLSPWGVRSLSRVYGDAPYTFSSDGRTWSIQYEPGHSTHAMFGGNSNWRGPVWFPLNFLLIESLEKFHYFYGDDFKIECPAGSGRMACLREVADELRGRSISLFLPDAKGRRPCHGEDARYVNDPNFKGLLLFYEFFHGENGHGLGASHQTGWTALVAEMIRSPRWAARRQTAVADTGGRSV